MKNEKKKIIERISSMKCNLLISYDKNRRFESISIEDCITYVKKAVSCKIIEIDFVNMIEITMPCGKIYITLFP